MLNPVINPDIFKTRDSIGFHDYNYADFIWVCFCGLIYVNPGSVKAKDWRPLTTESSPMLLTPCGVIRRHEIKKVNPLISEYVN